MCCGSCVSSQQSLARTEGLTRPPWICQLEQVAETMGFDILLYISLSIYKDLIFF
jgi:hypothetical protein